MTMILDKMEWEILSAILNRTVISGAELMKQTGASRPKELMEPIRKLQQNKLIEVSGDTLDEYKFPYASFGCASAAKATCKTQSQPV